MVPVGLSQIPQIVRRKKPGCGSFHDVCYRQDMEIPVATHQVAARRHVQSLSAGRELQLMAPAYRLLMIHAFTVAVAKPKSPVLSLRRENRHTEMRASRPPAEALLQDCLARLEEKVLPRTKFTFAFRLIWVKAKK
jgi:hypothetical protein